jgi:uncharacterized protein YndB with AHSA1/START domain
LVYDHGGYDERAPLFRVTVLFSFRDGKTTIDMTMALPTAEAAEETRKFIKKAGGNATWDRLAEYLGQEQSGRKLFVINRSFDFPIETMYEAWTNPESLSTWLPPEGIDMQFLRRDIRTGESTFWNITNHTDLSIYGRAEYREIRKPDRIVYTQEFCDQQENRTRHPQTPHLPGTILTTVEFTAEDSSQTRITVTREPVGDTTLEEQQAFVEGRSGMTQRWTGSFDKLEAWLECR